MTEETLYMTQMTGVFFEGEIQCAFINRNDADDYVQTSRKVNNELAHASDEEPGDPNISIAQVTVTVTIPELETGVINVYNLPVPSPGEKGEERMMTKTVTFVLTRDAHGLYAVYMGMSSDPGWIAHSGAKLNYEKAKQYYPGLKEEEYRR